MANPQKEKVSTLDKEVRSSLLNLRKVKKYLNSTMVSRQQEINSLFLALLTKTSCLLLGPRGTAKTELSRVFGEMVSLSVFDILITATTKPEQIFGQVDVPALAKGVVQYKTAGYAPTAEITMFDEVFKAGGTVLNGLLQFMNERIFRNGDLGIQKCPVHCVIGASNEVPSDQELLPFLDRFLLRHDIGYLGTSTEVKRMLGYSAVEYPKPEPLSKKQLAILQDAVNRVECAVNHVDTMLDIRRTVQSATGVSISDRRIRQSLRIIKAQALLKGRMEVEQSDLEVLAHLFWDDPAMAKKTQQLVMHKVDGVSAEVGAYEDAAIAAYNEAMKSGELDKALAQIQELYTKVETLQSAYGKRVAAKIRGVVKDIQRILNSRKVFEVIVAKDTDLGEHFKVTEQTSGLWSKDQLRSVGFKQRRKTGHWWQPVIDEKRFAKRLKAVLNVEPKIITLV